MSVYVILMIAVFIVGYVFIALESFTKVNKGAIALVMCIAVWALYSIGCSAGGITTGLELGQGGFSSFSELSKIIEAYLGEAGTTLFFLMGAMTIVEMVDQHGGLNFVSDIIKTRHKRKLLWRVAFMTALLSAVLDNLTTSIVMVMILRKLVPDIKDRIWYDVCIIIAANSGGAFSPIGDVTTIMLWNGKQITALGVISQIILPSMVSFIVPTAILQTHLSGSFVLDTTKAERKAHRPTILTQYHRRIVFAIGVGGLCLVPLFHLLTNLPPFMGILCVLGVLWLTTEIFYRTIDERDPMAMRVSNMLSRIDMSTILFFLGILMTVSALGQINLLTTIGGWLDTLTHGIGVFQHYVVTGLIGIFSAIVDNVPLVAASMGMYDINPLVEDFATDGVFWQLLAYCAGVGGSMLIIGSAAGVVVMGLENISFGWYLKNVTWKAFAGFIAGMIVYFPIHVFILPLLR
ncbi:MAG: sodium:proton antiporter NhaD [Prevotella sp.]|nr:sodium:proton antiporter NhaD [Prevotella sp.]MCD8305182.1 sodium:proton antiporter NhaD [Prevotella sp.]